MWYFLFFFYHVRECECCLLLNDQCLAVSWGQRVTFHDNNCNVRIVLDKHDELDWYFTSTLQQHVWLVVDMGTACYISWNNYDVHFALDKHDDLEWYITWTLQQYLTMLNMHTLSWFLPTSICSFSLVAYLA